jgi:hypothetical protein
MKVTKQRLKKKVGSREKNSPRATKPIAADGNNSNFDTFH